MICDQPRKLVLLILFLLSPVQAFGGLSEKYPGDAGIQSDPSVVFTENFEASSVGEIEDHWTDSLNTAGMNLTTDIAPGSAGTRSLRMTNIGGRLVGGEPDTGGHLYKRLDGYDRLYARFYVKFPSTSRALHHTPGMGGYNPPSNWPQGNAGYQPSGSDRFKTAIEPWGTEWRWDFYTYWMHMRSWTDNPAAHPTDAYYGNGFTPTPAKVVARDQWICVEQMVQLNDPTEFNGEQAFMIDGTLVQHLGPGFPNGYWAHDMFRPDSASPAFEGFQWRTTTDLNINFFNLLYYVTDVPDGEHNEIFFDDVVIAKEYIGCHSGSPSADPTIDPELAAAEQTSGDDTGQNSDTAAAPSGCSSANLGSAWLLLSALLVLLRSRRTKRVEL